MKTEVTDMTIGMDLSEASYEDAVIKLSNNFELPPYVNVFQWVHPTLKVSLWDADIAIVISAKYKNCDILISRDYRCNEWSVSQLKHDSDTIYEIHTDGA